MTQKLPGAHHSFRKAGAPARLTGTVTRWNDGDTYGFIAGDDGAQYFLSRDDLPRGTASLPAGTPVAYTSSGAPEPGERYLRARRVRVTGEPEAEP